MHMPRRNGDRPDRTVVISPKGLKNGTIEISSRDKSLQEKKPVDEAVGFVYDYVVDELKKLNCRL